MNKFKLLFLLSIAIIIGCKTNGSKEIGAKSKFIKEISDTEYNELIASITQNSKITANITQNANINISNLIEYAIDDELAKEFVRDYLKWGIWFPNYSKVRSVFFTFDEITATFNMGNARNEIAKYGFRIYFAEYTNSDKAKEYLKKKHPNNFEDYIGLNTVIIQIMNETNDTFISYNGDLLNYNLGELCPPCSSANPSGTDKDVYIK